MCFFEKLLLLSWRFSVTKKDGPSRSAFNICIELTIGKFYKITNILLIFKLGN